MASISTPAKAVSEKSDEVSEKSDEEAADHTPMKKEFTLSTYMDLHVYVQAVTELLEEVYEMKERVRSTIP